MRLYVEAVLDATPAKKLINEPPRTGASIKKMLRDASRQANDYNEAENQNALLLIALVADRSDNGKTLRALGLRPEELRRQLRHLTRAAAPSGNPLKMLDDEAKNALGVAHQIMRQTGCGRVSTAHLLLGILSNRELSVLRSLNDKDVDLDELARLARASITNDGEIATAQIRLTPSVKRALERARDVVPSRLRRRPISPQALLWGLLPGAATLGQQLGWDKSPDPLERVWSKFDVAPLEQVTNVMLGIDAPVPPASYETRAWLDWRGAIPGTIWTSFCAVNFTQFHNSDALWWFFAGFCVALCADWWGRTKSAPELRSLALSFQGGSIVAVAMWTFFALVFDSR